MSAQRLYEIALATMRHETTLAREAHLNLPRYDCSGGCGKGVPANADGFCAKCGVKAILITGKKSS